MRKKFLVGSIVLIVLVAFSFVIYWYYNTQNWFMFTYFPPGSNVTLTTTTIPEERLCLKKANEYLTKKYQPASYNIIKKNDDSIFFWEKNDDTIACKSDYEKKTLLGWTFMILSSIDFNEKLQIEDVTKIFFEKIPVIFDDYKCGYLDNYTYICEANKILEEGLYIYRIFGYNESFDTFDYTLNKEIKNSKTEIYFCYLTNENEIWKLGHYPCVIG